MGSNSNETEAFADRLNPVPAVAFDALKSAAFADVFVIATRSPFADGVFNATAVAETVTGAAVIAMFHRVPAMVRDDPGGLSSEAAQRSCQPLRRLTADKKPLVSRKVDEEADSAAWQRTST